MRPCNSPSTVLRIRRRSIPVGDDIWKVEDVTEFEDGRSIVRRYYCELVEPTRVHVTGDDMPDGAELRLEEGGYRIAPYRLAVPVGPVRFTLRCRDSATPLPGGGVHGRIEMSWLGLPVARLSDSRTQGRDRQALRWRRGRHAHGPTYAADR